MKINSEQAKNIILSLNDLIYDDIYVYDDNGTLLATNKDKATEEILDYGKKVSKNRTILVENVEDLNSKAILLPVNIGKNLAGIIGLVGDYAIISQYSGLVVKIVEILLSESIYYQRKIRNAENNRLFINEVIFGHDNYESLTIIANIIGIKVDDLKYLALINIKNIDKTKITNDLIIESIEKTISKKHLVGEQKGNIAIMFTIDNIEEVKHELENISDYLNQKYKKNILISLSDKIETYKDCKKAYFQAKQTLSLGSNKSDKGIFLFNNYSLELLFLDVDEELVDSFISEVFTNLKNSEITEMEILIRSYINNNTSLNTTSKELFIHKNTLQYRLNKIYELTGYNPRNTKELFKLFTAINLYNRNEIKIDESI